MKTNVSYHVEDRIGIIRIDNPPVNAFGHAVRQGLMDAIEKGEADKNVEMLVIVGAGRTFSAGADIREFGGPRREPSLGDVIDRLECVDKLTVAAIHGSALGGGMEVTLGCDYRVALDTAKMGLPEVNLGLLPGAGGTQRLPRLVGIRTALDFILEGKPVMANSLKTMGIIDETASGDLKTAAVAFAKDLLDRNMPLRRLRDLRIDGKNHDIFAEFEKKTALRKRGFLAPAACIEAVKASCELAFAAGLKLERELFVELLATPQSAAQRHVFFAERQAGKVSDISPDTVKRPINMVGVIGAGTMGGGIAMNFLNVGINVVLLDTTQDKLDKALVGIRKTYSASAKKGRISSAQVEERMSLMKTSVSYEDLACADLVIEAVFEDMAVKKEVFGHLDRVCKDGAILATNTSTLDINEIAQSTKRPHDVIGMHFFSPANVMKLLENIRGEQTSDEVIATVMELSRRIGKISVLVGVCYGFVGNRMLHKRQAQAFNLVNHGATPAQVDKVLYDFGFPMGPYAMSDLAGLDVGYRIRQGLRETDPDKAPARFWLDELVEKGRLGQKTQAGVFDYKKGERTARPSDVTKAVIEKYRQENGFQTLNVSDEEILDRCLFAMVNEGARILEEGIAARSLDIDIVWIYGYGFPAFRGGPMFWADQIGVDKVYAKVKRFHEETGDEDWAPSPLLRQLAAQGKSFADL